MPIKKWNTYHTRGIQKKYVYRYMDERKVLSFLEHGALYMPSMNRFDDKLEGISTYDITEVKTAYDICFVDDENSIDPNMMEDWQNLKEVSKEKLRRIGKQLEKSQEGHYVSCWFNSNRESDGMWRFYSRENGFAVRMDRKLFQEAIKKSINTNLTSNSQRVIVGRIKYQDYPRVIENEQASTVLYLAFRKDESFSHEKEYRVVVLDTSSGTKPNFFSYQLKDFQDLPITIIVHPAMGEPMYQDYKQRFQSYGSNIIVRKSELEPFYQFYDRLKE